jgi:hypothetical protein
MVAFLESLALVESLVDVFLPGRLGLATAEAGGFFATAATRESSLSTTVAVAIGGKS